MARPQNRRNPLASTQEAAIITSEMVETLYYDYEMIPAENRERVRQAALDIKPRLKRTVREIFAVGAKLNEVKDLLPHGEWGRWLAQEFDLSVRMAQRFMGVASRLGAKYDKLSHLGASTLYELAAPSTDDEVIAEVEARVDAGERVTYATTKRLIEGLKAEFVVTWQLESGIQQWLSQNTSGVITDQIEALESILDETPIGRELFSSLILSEIIPKPNGIDLRNAISNVLGQLKEELVVEEIAGQKPPLDSGNELETGRCEHEDCDAPATTWVISPDHQGTRLHVCNEHASLYSSTVEKPVDESTLGVSVIPSKPQLPTAEGLELLQDIVQMVLQQLGGNPEQLCLDLLGHSKISDICCMLRELDEEIEQLQKEKQ